MLLCMSMPHWADVPLQFSCVETQPLHHVLTAAWFGKLHHPSDVTFLLLWGGKITCGRWVINTNCRSGPCGLWILCCGSTTWRCHQLSPSDYGAPSKFLNSFQGCFANFHRREIILPLLVDVTELALAGWSTSQGWQMEKFMSSRSNALLGQTYLPPHHRPVNSQVFYVRLG